MNINTTYSENTTQILVTVCRGRAPIVKIVTDKNSKNTVVEVFKEYDKKPIETVVWNSVDEFRQK